MARKYSRRCWRRSRALNVPLLSRPTSYWSGGIGERFADALIDRAAAGVKVHVMLDWVGCSKMSSELLRRMLQAGIEVQRYHALRWFGLGKLNNRTHRKVLIVDGAVGFTGG